MKYKRWPHIYKSLYLVPIFLFQLGCYSSRSRAASLMGAEKVTEMVLRVDLQCPRCYKKVKKTLCKFPQIRDQAYDEKANTVTIKVVCCSPEKIRDKLCYKGGKVIKSIDIKEPHKPEKPKVVIIEKPKELEKPKVVVIKEPEKLKEAAKPKADGAPQPEKLKEAPKPEPAKKPEAAAKPPPAEPVKGPEPTPVSGVPSVFPYCGPSYDGYSAGPYYHGYGFPPPPPQPCYEGYYGYGNGQGHGYGYGYGRVGQVSRNDNYFTEENPQACSIM